MTPGRIFISYRRDDSAGYARAVYDELVRRFGDERVFIDVDDIAAGRAFDETIAQAIGEARVLLVMIGPRWRGDRDGQPARIDDPADLVRREVAAALASDALVVPLLIDGARMPTEADLPSPLHPLARRHALELRNSRYRDDIERLLAVLRDAVGDAPPDASTPQSRRPLLLALGAGSVLALIGVAGYSLWSARRDTRPDINGEWQADVGYDWGARHAERFVFGGSGSVLHGSASFLRVARGIVEGEVAGDTVRFTTTSLETAGDTSATLRHRYRATLVGDELRFVMQTDGGVSSHEPVHFVARRVRAGG